MKDTQRFEKPDLEFYHELLLQRFGTLRRQMTSAQSKAEEDLIELALNRIGWGNYRSCLECGADIGDERLLADPTSMTCGKCTSATR
ncbi:MAG: hypothetical protein ACYDAI_03315 [Trichloromonadaceae bacterium]